MSRSTTAMLAVDLWTVVVAAVLLFDLGYRPDLVLSCMKLVGHRQGCETAQVQVNDARFGCTSFRC